MSSTKEPIVCGGVVLGDEPRNAASGLVCLGPVLWFSCRGTETLPLFDRFRRYLEAKDKGTPIQYPFTLVPATPRGNPEVRLLWGDRSLCINCGPLMFPIEVDRMRALCADFEGAVEKFGGRDKLLLSTLRDTGPENVH